MDLIQVWIFVSFLTCVTCQDPVANLPQGRVVGIKVFTENSFTPIEAFFGIPYAAPPIGRLRFSPPERHTGWRRTLFAHRMHPRCPDSGNNTDVSEDCLYLNIWAPRRVEGKQMPVVIVLYSESWIQNGVNLPCQELAAGGLVVVTVAYRLHILAFFTLKSITARGNLALLDQYMALIWIRENIAAFGGNPNSITLMGHSAGADSVLLHIVSPRSIGLFHRAIIMSPQNVWKAIEKSIPQNNSLPETLSRKIIHSLGCSNSNDNEILQCLKIRSLTDLMALYKVDWTNALQPNPDYYLPESEQYSPRTLSAALASTKSSIEVDVLLGTVDLEAINYEYKYEDFLKEDSNHVFDYAISTLIPNLLSLLSLDRSENSALLTQIIQWQFLGLKKHIEDEKDMFNLIEAIARMESSAKWGAGSALLAARLARKISHNLYVYHYSQASSVDLSGRTFNFTGATHGAELIALLGDSLMLQVARRPASQSEKEISNKFRQYVTNFVKFGSPDSQKQWPKYIVGDSYIHEICHNKISECNTDKSTKDIDFWLQYLPRLANRLSSNEQAEKITSGNGDNRFRGGVLAMCGVSFMLLLLLGISIAVIYTWRTRRPLISILM
ncbi:unnamed protein product, partial [Brenthis ino]